MPTPPTFQAALFDWDGVVIDSHHAHEQAWAILSEELGLPLAPGFFKATFGMRNDNIIPQFTNWADPADLEKIRALGDRKEALYRQVLRRDGIEPLPGVREWLAELRAHGIPCSVGSSTSLENIQTIMEMTGLGPCFDAITAERDVTRGKPDPDVFLKAAAKVNTPADCCVVFEDAHVGIAAALAAGAKAVAVTTTHPAESFTTAHLTVAKLTELSVPALRALWTTG